MSVCALVPLCLWVHLLRSSRDAESFTNKQRYVTWNLKSSTLLLYVVCVCVVRRPRFAIHNPQFTIHGPRTANRDPRPHPLVRVYFSVISFVWKIVRICVEVAPRHPTSNIQHDTQSSRYIRTGRSWCLLIVAVLTLTACAKRYYSSWFEFYSRIHGDTERTTRSELLFFALFILCFYFCFFLVCKYKVCLFHYDYIYIIT